MLTLVLYLLGALVVFGGLFAIAVFALPKGEQISDPAPDVKQWTMAERSLTADDIVSVRLPIALRGYRFAETDLLLDRLTDELRQRDAEIERLRSGVAVGSMAPPADTSVQTWQSRWSGRRRSAGRPADPGGA